MEPGQQLKLLFDQNLARRLVTRLTDLFPDSAHVRDVGLASARDELVWEHAAANGFAIVTKDDDFRQLSFLRGPPPQVVWVRLGNCTTADVENTVRARFADLQAFAADAGAALLVLTRDPPRPKRDTG